MEEQNIRLQQGVRQNVHSIGRWYKFFAILGIVGVALMVFGALVFLVAGSVIGDRLSEDYPFPLWILGVLYLVMAVVYIPIIIYLMRAAGAAREATGLNNNEAASRFMLYTKRFWKFYGILTIVMLGLCVLAVPAAAVVAVAAV